MSCDSLHVNLQQSILEGGIPSYLGQIFLIIYETVYPLPDLLGVLYLSAKGMSQEGGEASSITDE